MRRLGIREELARLLEAAPVGVVTLNDRGAVRSCTANALRLLGVDEVDAIGRPLAQLLDPEAAEPLEDMLAAAARRPSTPPSATVAVPALPGRHVELLAAEFSAVEGIGGFVVLVADATERLQADEARERVRRQQSLLARAGAVLDASLEPLETLQRIATLPVPELADLCVIEAPDGEGGLRIVTIAATEASIAEQVRRLRRDHPLRVDSDHPVAEVLRVGAPRLLRKLDGDAERTLVSRDRRYQATMERLGYRSAVIAPLIARGRRHGVMSLLRVGPVERHGDDELRLIEDFARRAATALDNATLYERERSIAERLQRSLLPRIVAPAGLRVATRYVPGSDGTHVGGDVYDLIDLGAGRHGFVVGDVAGRGLGAASVMGQLRAFVRAHALDAGDPRDVLATVDRLLDRFEIGDFATFAYGVLDLATGAARVASAGHPPPLLVPADGEPTFVAVARDLPLGVDAGRPRAASTRFTLERGTTLVLYTDGLVERRGEDPDVGLARLAGAAAAVAGADPERLCDALLAIADRERPDDVALIALRRDDEPG